MLLLARGRTIYNGAGGPTSSEYFASRGSPCPEGYNIADHLLDIASEPPKQTNGATSTEENGHGMDHHDAESKEGSTAGLAEKPGPSGTTSRSRSERVVFSSHMGYATTFLTQLEILSQREWKILRRCIIH